MVKAKVKVGDRPWGAPVRAIAIDGRGVMRLPPNRLVAGLLCLGTLAWSGSPVWLRAARAPRAFVCGRPHGVEGGREVYARLATTAAAIAVRIPARPVRRGADLREPGGLVASLPPASGGHHAARRRAPARSRDVRRRASLHRAGSGRRRETPAAASSQEIATRLATILWNSAPDAALLQEAQRNRLSDPAALERQIQRMLADDRARPSSRASSSRGCSSTSSPTPIRTRSTSLTTTSPCAIPSPRKPSCSCSVNCATTATLSSSGVQLHVPQ